MPTRKVLEKDRDVRAILSSWGIGSLDGCAAFISSAQDKAAALGDATTAGELTKHIDYFAARTGIDVKSIAQGRDFRAPKRLFLDFIKNCLTVADPGPAGRLTEFRDGAERRRGGTGRALTRLNDLLAATFGLRIMRVAARGGGVSPGGSVSLTELEARLAHVTDALGRIQTQLALNSWVTGHSPELLRDRILTLGSLLWPVAVAGAKKIRIGRPMDGGYVMLDDFGPIRGALSFGINHDDAWDSDIARLGIDVHQYDHTVDGPPTRNERFSFFKEMISSPSDRSGTSLAAAVARLPDGPLLLKCDIEGSEWDVFETATPDCLRRFSQIVCEFHGFGAVGDDAAYHKMENALRALHEAFCVVHVHANNGGPWSILGGVPFPSVLEVTFANRARYTFQETSELFPTERDSPNAPNLPELYLGSFRYRPPASRSSGHAIGA